MSAINVDVFVKEIWVFNLTMPHAPHKGDRIKSGDTCFVIEQITWITPTFIQMDVIEVVEHG